jgi:hypothetical protein
MHLRFSGPTLQVFWGNGTLHARTPITRMPTQMSSDGDAGVGRVPVWFIVDGLLRAEKVAFLRARRAACAPGERG